MLTVTSDEMRAMVGQTIGPSEWIDLTQDMIDTYADAVHDHNWIDVDVPRATAAFGGTIAHGLLTLSLAPPLAQTLFEISDLEADLNYGFEKVRFLSVVHGGDRVRLRLEVLGLEPRGVGELLRMQYTMEVENAAKPAVVAHWVFMLFPVVSALARQAGLTAQE